MSNTNTEQGKTKSSDKLVLTYEDALRNDSSSSERLFLGLFLTSVWDLKLIVYETLSF